MFNAKQIYAKLHLLYVVNQIYNLKFDNFNIPKVGVRCGLLIFIQVPTYAKLFRTK